MQACLLLEACLLARTQLCSLPCAVCDPFSAKRSSVSSLVSFSRRSQPLPSRCAVQPVKRQTRVPVYTSRWRPSASALWTCCARSPAVLQKTCRLTMWALLLPLWFRLEITVSALLGNLQLQQDVEGPAALQTLQLLRCRMMRWRLCASRRRSTEPCSTPHLSKQLQACQGPLSRAFQSHLKHCFTPLFAMQWQGTAAAA